MSAGSSCGASHRKLLLTSIVVHERIEILLLTSLDHEHVHMHSHICNSASIVAHEKNEILLQSCPPPAERPPKRTVGVRALCARRVRCARQVVEQVELGGHGQHRIGAHGRIEIPQPLPIVLPHRKQRTPGRPLGSIRLH